MKKPLNKLQFNFNLMHEFYIEGGFLQESELESLISHTNAVRSLSIEGFNWLPSDQAPDQFRHLPVSIHYRAMAAAYGLDFDGIEDFYVQCINAGALPAHVLNVTEFYEQPEKLKGHKIGELLVRLGLIPESTVQRALGIQQVIESEIKIKPFLASIINNIAQMSAPNLYQALGIQVGIKYVSLDESVDKIAAAVREAFKANPSTW
jgi:hypothetical protein